METITILNKTPYKKQPIPEIGKEYHIFDDGKIKPSRLYTATILEAIPFNNCKDAQLLEAWRNEVDFCDWLYAKETDYFIKADSNFDDEPLYFVRTKDGGWFSIDYPDAFMSARLDIDGSLYEKMKEWYDVEE